MKLNKWWIVLIISVLAMVGLAPTAQADQIANGPVFTVMNTSETPPDGVWFRNSSHTADTDRVTGHGVYMGERVQLRCFSWGDAVGAYNNTLWYNVLNVTRPTNAGVDNSGFLNAHYIDDGTVANQVVGGVPDCSAPAAAPPAVRLAQGPAASAGYRYAITLDHFAANSVVPITCYDSVSPSGFYTFNLRTDGSGHGSTESYCYSGDGPDHWVIAGGVQSNHVTWGASSGGGGTGGGGTGGGGTGGGGTGGGSTSGGYVPCNVRLNASAGTRERQLRGMTSDLNSAAQAAAIRCQTLAHVIYHEGGNYLSARRSVTQLAELNAPVASVGIGQMTIPTAKLVAVQAYQDWETAFDEDIVVRTNLIYDLPYAIKYSAGYIKVLEQAGVRGDFQSFMAYSLTVQGAQAWKNTGYSMQRSTLATIPGLRVDIFIKRKTFYDQAVKAIGQ